MKKGHQKNRHHHKQSNCSPFWHTVTQWYWHTRHIQMGCSADSWKCIKKYIIELLNLCFHKFRIFMDSLTNQTINQQISQNVSFCFDEKYVKIQKMYQAGQKILVKLLNYLPLAFLSRTQCYRGVPVIKDAVTIVPHNSSIRQRYVLASSWSRWGWSKIIFAKILLAGTSTSDTFNSLI